MARFGGRSGFTLIEVVVVVTVMAILARVGIPLMDAAVLDARLAAGTGEVVVALEFAQGSAVASGRSCRVTISAAANSVLVEQIVYGADPLVGGSEIAEAGIESESYATMSNLLRPGRLYSVTYSQEPRLSQVDVFSVTLNGGGSSIVFDSLGSPSTGGTVVLKCGARQATVSIDSSTGKATQTN